MTRQQMTFFVSFWEAINSLPKKDQLPLFRAVISYGLFGKHAETLSASQTAFFSLVQPVLDKSRKKASNRKQTENKPETNGEQNGQEKEGDKERDKEKEYEGEGDKEQTGNSAPPSGKPFTAFWEAYPSKIDRESAWEAWKALSPSPETARQIMLSLEAWKRSGQWTEDGGRYIPKAAKFLSKWYWKNIPLPNCKKEIPKGASGELGAAELEAIQRVIAEDPGKRQLDEDEQAAIRRVLDEPPKEG